jgi:ADP-ribose pyrophosphatase YjhB (NUDIX family)
MSTANWLNWLQRLQTLAHNGLTYAENSYDIERYEKLRDLADEMAAVQANIEPHVIRTLFAHEKGYTTPKVDVRGVVFREDRILLVREKADGFWSLPGGWADIGNTPSEAVEREIREESGFEARAVKLLAVYDRNQHSHDPYPFHAYKLFFLCGLLGGEAQTSNETSDVDFFAADALPPLSTTRVTASQIARFFVHHGNPDLPTDFD